MKVHYTGRKAELTDAERSKIEKKFEKVHRVLDRHKDLEAHVIVSRQKHHAAAEITLRALHHTLAVTHSAVQPFVALQGALGKLEKLAVRNKHKLIDQRRQGRQRGQISQVVAETVLDIEREIEQAAVETPRSGPRIVPATNVAPKPMTAEGAALQLESSDAIYLAFRDADSGSVNVLIKDSDGTFELVEGS